MRRSKLDDTLDRTRANVLKLTSQMFVLKNMPSVLLDKGHSETLLCMDEFSVPLVEYALRHVDFAKIGAIITVSESGILVKNLSYKSLASGVTEVFMYWSEKTGHTKTKPTNSRISMIKSRLKDYTVEDLKLGVDGIMLSDWHTGRHPQTRGRTYTSLNHVFGDEMKLDSFIGHAKAQKKGDSSSMSEYDRAMAERKKRGRR